MKINNQEELTQAVRSILEFLEQNKSVTHEIEAPFEAPLEATPPVAMVVEPPLELVISEPVIQSNFQQLRAILESDVWPEATPSFLICEENEDDKFERAEGIIDAVNIDFANKKILDFGCGEGHVVKKLAAQGHNVVGFDIKKQGVLEWDESSDPFSCNGKGQLTTDWQKILAQGLFDVVVLYDVMDHCADPVAALQNVRQVCTTNTHIFSRFHPFCGPHGGHLYRTINKAYVHLFFTEDELRQMGAEPDFAQKVLFPLGAVDEWLKKSGFAVITHSMVRVNVSPFFKDTALVRSRLPSAYAGREFPEWQMSQAFNDYVLNAI